MDSWFESVWDMIISWLVLFGFTVLSVFGIIFHSYIPTLVLPICLAIAVGTVWVGLIMASFQYVKKSFYKYFKKIVIKIIKEEGSK